MRCDTWVLYYKQIFYIVGQEGDVHSEQEREQRQALTEVTEPENNLHSDMKTTL